jgi:DNA polymerase-3 subunit epsilon
MLELFEQLPICDELIPQQKMPRNLLIVDLETTGLDPKDCEVIEVAASLFDVKHRAVVSSLAFLMPCDSNAAEEINHIPASLSQTSSPWRTGLIMLTELLAVSDCLIAHNAAFDRKWFGRGNLPKIWQPWLCSMIDFEWGSRGGTNLRDLAVNHGVTVAKAHRALADVELLAGVLASREDLEELLEGAVAPKITIAARVSYERREEAKTRGFNWNRLTRRWEKRMTGTTYALSDFPFGTFVVEER